MMIAFSGIPIRQIKESQRNYFCPWIDKKKLLFRKFCETNASRQTAQARPSSRRALSVCCWRALGIHILGIKLACSACKTWMGQQLLPCDPEREWELLHHPATSPMVHDARAEAPPRQKAPLNTDVWGTLQSTTQALAVGAATCRTEPTHSQRLQNRETPFYAPFKPVLHSPPNRCRVPDLESIPHARCATVLACQHQPSKPAWGRRGGKTFTGVISITQFFSSEPQGRSSLLTFSNYANYP